MNILYHFRTRGVGAEAVHISGMANAFEKLGHRVFFSSPTGIDPRSGAGATPYAKTARPMPRGVFELLELLYNVPAFVRNLRLARRHGCQLIYERHAFFLFSTALVARLLRCRLVVEVNELIGDPRVRAQPVLAPIARWADRFLFRRADLIVTVSPHLKRRVQEYGVEAAKVLVLPNAVSEEELELAIPAPEVRRGLPDSAFVLGFVGWLVEWHRLDFLIEALAAPGLERVVLYVVGEGPLREELEQKARQLGVPAVFAGAQPRSRIPAILRSMDVCVVPHSNIYRSPIKLFEFMSQGRPVLAPRTEPIEAVMEDQSEGLLFTPLDEDSFRVELHKLLDSKLLCDKIGGRARARVAARHTWEKNAEAVLASMGKEGGTN